MNSMISRAEIAYGALFVLSLASVQPVFAEGKPSNSANSKGDSAEAQFKIRSLASNNHSRKHADLSPRGFAEFSHKIESANSVRQIKSDAKLGSKNHSVHPNMHKITTKTVTTHKTK